MLDKSFNVIAVFVFLMICSLVQGWTQSIKKKTSIEILKVTAYKQWFVTGTGDDANSGTSINTSFHTLRKAASVANAGDVVMIGNGIYTDTNRASNNAVLAITQPGRPDAWITWKSIPGHHPVIEPVGWNGIVITGSYHILDGLTIIGKNDSITLIDALNDAKNPTPNPAFNSNGISIDGRKNSPDAKPHHVIIRNCSVSKCPGGGISGLEVDYLTVEDCRVFENAWFMRYAGSGITTLNNWAFDDKPGYHIIIQRNLVWNNKTLVPWEKTGKLSDGNGIILDVTDLSTGATNPNADAAVTTNESALVKPKRPEWHARALIANNVSAYNGGSGIHTFRTRHVDIINNTTYWNGQVVGYQELFPNRSDDIIILNNIIVPRPGGKVTSDNRNTNIKWNYNLYPKAQNVFTGANDIVSEPLFESIPTYLTMGSFRLKKGSAGINNATNEIPQPADISGKKRPIGIGRDRGAYEQ
jgi:hypothetical protein